MEKFDENQEFQWLLVSRGWTTTFVESGLSNLFKVHSFGIGGLIAYLAATQKEVVCHSTGSRLLIAIFGSLAVGLLTVMLAYKSAYDAQDKFSLDAFSKDAYKSSCYAKVFCWISLGCYVLAALLFGWFLWSRMV